MTELQNWKKTVNKLGDAIERLLVSPGRAHNSTNTGRINNDSNVNNQRVCFNCSAMGHLKRRCNLASGQEDPNTLCQLCSQRGHMAIQCKLFIATRIWTIRERPICQLTQGEVPWADKCRQ